MKSKSIFPFLLVALLLALAGYTFSASADEADFLEVGGDKLYYESIGDGYPLVLLSGGSGMDLRQWDLITPSLAEKYRVIRLDPRGIGSSENPTAKYADTDDIEALLNHLELDQAVLIGLSSSGGMVLEFASQYPDRVAGVVAAAPFIPGFEFDQSMLTRLDVFNKAAQEGKRPFLDAMFDDPYFFPAPRDRSVRSGARSNMGENYDKRLSIDPSLYVSIDPPLIEQLAKIEAPVLLVVGDLEHPEVKRRNAFLLDEISRAEEKVVSQAGHNTPQESPEAFLKAVVPFLEQIAQ